MTTLHRIFLVACVAGWLLAHGATAHGLPIDFSRFHTPGEVDSIMAELAAAHPTRCRIVEIGHSVEGRPIKALKISDNVAVDEPEADVVFIGLHHAREWITVEMALYLAEQILTRYGSDTRLRNDVDALEIWIIPVANPDGFRYTSLPGGNRFWRKNRRNNGDGTYGVDLNRNWGYEWGLNSGSSPDTRSETYRGPAAFSEPEIRALRDFLNGLDNLEALISYHSFSQLFLRPWSYTTADPPGEETLHRLVLRSIDRIRAVHGLAYAEDIWYTSSGEATDYLWGEMRVAAFTPEMRPASGGAEGFAPPPEVILPNNEENLPAALALIHDAGGRELWIRDHAADTGAEPSAVWTASGWSRAFWVSPDIWTEPENLAEGTTVDLHVRVHNATGAARTNVRVDVYWTDPRISLEFPNPAANLIASRTVTVPGGGLELTVPWTVPTGTNSWGERHWCVGAVIMHADDLPLTTQAQRSSNIAVRNFNTEPLLAGSNLIVAATNFLDVDAELAVVIERQTIPNGWQVIMPDPPRRRTKTLAAIERKARLLGAKGRLLKPGETVYVPVRVIPPPGVKPGQQFDLHVHGALLPLLPGKREAVGNGYTYRVVLAPPEQP